VPGFAFQSVRHGPKYTTRPANVASMSCCYARSFHLAVGEWPLSFLPTQTTNEGAPCTSHLGTGDTTGTGTAGLASHPPQLASQKGPFLREPYHVRGAVIVTAMLRNVRTPVPQRIGTATVEQSGCGYLFSIFSTVDTFETYLLPSIDYLPV
jgi:hypothetical protein